MIGAVLSLSPGIPVRRFQAHPTTFGGTSSTQPCCAGTRLSTASKDADPGQESATASTAATGMPPELHEPDTVIVARPRQLGNRAHRMARYKVIRRRRTARTLRGAWASDDAPPRQAEGTSLS